MESKDDDLKLLHYPSASSKSNMCLGSFLEVQAGSSKFPFITEYDRKGEKKKKKGLFSEDPREK